MSETMTPSARVIKKSNEIKSTKDALGRIIKYKKLKPSDMLDLVSIIGSERSINPISLSMCSAVYKVTEIDGTLIFPPETMSELKVAMDELGDEGLSAMYDTNRDQPEVKEEKEDEKPAKEKK